MARNIATAKVTGLDDVLDKLKEFQRGVVLDAAREAVRNGSEIVADEAKRRAKVHDDPKTTNDISKNIGYITKWTETRLEMRGRIGIVTDVNRSSEGKTTSGNAPGGDTYYWYFLEMGTSKMAARPFLRPALTAAKQRAFEEVVRTLKQKIIAAGTTRVSGEQT